MDEENKTSNTPQSLEALIARLEEIATLIQEGQLGLEESIELYEEGRRIAQICQDRLTAAQHKLEILSPSRSSDSDIQPDVSPEQDGSASSKNLLA
ncbi:MAG: exodeoxyribonuclease VII small subunit [Candidatus Thermochlorobacter sp.]